MNSSSPHQSEAALHAIDYWQVIKTRYGLILLTLFLVTMTALVITYVMPSRYESTAEMELKPRPMSSGAIGNTMNSFTAPVRQMTPQFFATEFAKIKSRNALTKVVDKLNLVVRLPADSKDTAIQILEGIVDTQNTRGTDLISIRVRHTDKVLARDIAEEVASAYRDYRNEIETRDQDKAIEELDKAVRNQSDKVEECRKTLTSIVTTKNIIFRGNDAYFQSGVDESSSARNAQNEYDKLKSERIQLKTQIDSLLKYDADQLMVYVSGLNLPDNTIKALLPMYQQAQRELESLKVNGLGDNHPRVLSEAKQIQALKQQLNEGVVNLRSTLQAQLEMVESRFKEVEKDKDKTQEDAVQKAVDNQDYVDAKKEFEINQELLTNLKLKQVDAQIQRHIPFSSVEMHSEPTVGEAPVSPNMKMNLGLGAVVGLIFGVGIAFFLEYLDTSVKSLEDVELYLKVPVLAVIPKDVGLLYKQSGLSPDAEAYRILRTNIEFNRKNPEDNAITVVSGGAGEGKSTTLVNLAYVCAQGGYTTLMIDADLRRPRLHTLFDISNSVGLTNYLTTDIMLEDVILQTTVDNLFFMPSGILPADAVGILNSRRMSELIQDVKQRFDLVLIDSPPILGVSDASVLASEVDLTMIVVQHRKLPRNMLMRVKQSVENVGGHVLGVVLNNVDIRSDSQYQYYTSYYTYYAPTEAQAPIPSSTAAKAKSGAVSRPSVSVEPAPQRDDDELY